LTKKNGAEAALQRALIDMGRQCVAAEEERDALRQLVRDLRAWVEHDGVSIAHGTREPDAWPQLSKLDVRIDAAGCAESAEK